jgi:cytoskeletal protein CcmA (bactofilin family)
MSDPAVDLSLPTKPVGPSRPPLMPARVPDLAVSDPFEVPHPESSWKRAPRSDQVERRTLVVGGNVSVSGEIKFCDRLVVDGNVEASLHECRELEISNRGVFQGNAAVAVAEIRGRFEGDLVVRKRLVIRSTGRLSGSITYGEIEIESGAQVAGILMPGKEDGTKLLPPAFAKRQASSSVGE